MKLTFLRAANGRKFAKSITKNQTGYSVEPYPNIREMHSETVEVSSLTEFKDALVSFAAKGYALLKGNTKKQLVNESRKGSHDPIAPTWWLCIDFDKLLGITHPRQALQLLGNGLQDVSFIYQPSASASYIDSADSFSGHLFLQLERPVHPGVIKNWLIQQNLENMTLNTQLQLTADGRSLRYKLDITTCQNDKLVFIAPPQTKGFNPLINLDPDQYFEVYQGVKPTVDLDFSQFAGVNGSVIQENQKKRINELRKQAGLPLTKVKTTRMYNRDVITNPSHCEVTGIKDQGAFVRLNIDGGDSWAYWHPKENWEVIYSFKDDTAFRAKEFVPSYYNEKQEEASQQHEVYKVEEGESGLRYIAFLDRKTDTYYRGTWSPQTQTLELDAAGSRDKIDNFFVVNNLPVPEALPEWDYEFKFDNPAVVNFEKGFLNRYVTPPIMLQAILSEDQPEEAQFGTISSIIMWVLGNDRDAYNHFLNWLACLVQLRRPPRTAWIFQGTTGTGKGVLFHYILTPLIGATYVGTKRLPDLINRFNRYNRDHVLVLVDEADMDELTSDAPAISASLKNLITEPRVEFEAKGKQRVFVDNYCSYIFTSNQPTPIHVEYNDRRFNVAPRQEESLPKIPSMLEKLEAELPAFAKFLMNYAVNTTQAHKPLINEANMKLRRAGLSSLHEITAAFRDGDFSYFVEQIPLRMPRDMFEQQQLRDYIDTLELIIKTNDEEGAKLSRDQAESLFKFLDDKTPHKNKFTIMLKRQGLNNQVLWDNDKNTTFRGYKVPFAISSSALDEFQTKRTHLHLETEKQSLRSVG